MTRSGLGVDLLKFHDEENVLHIHQNYASGACLKKTECNLVAVNTTTSSGNGGLCQRKPPQFQAELRRPWGTIEANQGP
jgi:hypothetical protein